VPDGFDPHKELQRIHMLREMMITCREDYVTVGKKLQLRLIKMGLEELDKDEPNVSILSLAHDVVKDVANRGFGKAAQSLNINVDAAANMGLTGKVQIHLPDNGRDKLPEGPVIDA